MNPTPFSLLCSLFLLLPFTLNAATYLWTAGGDGISIYQETNWTLNGDGLNAIPRINGNTSVNHDLIINSGTPGGTSGGSNTLDLGTGSLTINGGTFRMSLNNGAGISRGAINLNDGTIIAQFLTNSEVTLGNGTLSLGGTGNPLNNSTVAFSAGATGEIRSTETPADFISEHLSKITVNGLPAEIGNNFEVISDGSTGSIARLSAPSSDFDNDGLDDTWETTYFGNLTASDGFGDFDNDGLNDLAEFTTGTLPNNPDSDDDLLRDGEEVNTYNTDPTLPDTDGDSNPDSFEVAKGTNPNDIASKTERPNIIFIFADDLGYGDLGVLWQNNKPGKKHKTPFFDQMAAEGIILNRHYCPAPVCAPSRSSLLSGLHQGHANIRDNQFDKELEDNHNLANTLQRVGYSTALIGKWGTQGGGGNPAAWPAYPTKRGFDYFFGYVRHGDGHTHYPDHVTDSRGKKELYDQNTEIRNNLDKCFTPDLFTARAKKLIIDEVNDGDEQPFFLFLAYDTPHAALQLPTIAYPGWNSSDDLDDRGFGVSGGVQWIGTPGNMINTATGTIDSYRHPDYTTGVGNSWTDVEERFATLVRRMDDNIGDLRKTLEDLGIAENTLIVFSSDNGPHSEDYLNNGQTNDGSSYLPTSFDSYGPFEGQKRDCWEGGIREPSLAVWPGTISPGSLTTLPSQLHDWLPTFCELAGATTPARTDGVSLVPTLTGIGTQKTPTTYIEYSTGGSTPNWSDFDIHGGTTRSQAQVIYLDGYKGIRNNPGSANTDFDIYDTLTDFEEATNLSNTNSYFTDLNQRMKDRVLQIRQPDTSATRPWDSANVPVPNNLPPLTPGTQYKTYTGLWNWVPEFTELGETGNGESTNLNLSVLPQSDLARGYLQTGFLNIPSPGVWTFTINSDSGAFLRIHDIMVVDDDYDHDGTAKSGAVRLAAGSHPYRLYYKNDPGNSPVLTLDWAGPGIANQPIPDSAFLIEGTPDPIPVANPDFENTVNHAPVVINVLANDLDDGLPSTLSVASVSSPVFGSASIVPGGILYTPDGSIFTTDSFHYSITDGLNTVSGTVEVTNQFQSNNIWIPLNESTGPDIFEASGYKLGTLSGFANPDAARIDGVHGKALTFDGNDDQISLTGIPALPTGHAPRTVMCWVRATAGAASENQTMFGYGNNSNGERFTFRLNGSNRNSTTQELRLEVQGGSIVGTTIVADGNWHHVAAVCDDFNENGSLEIQETRLYIDGVLDGIQSTANRTINTSNGSTAVLGGSNHAGNYNFNGDIDDFRLYPSALSAAEIAAAFSETNNLAAAWHRQFFGEANFDWSADLDGDGLPRLLEYALGGQPGLKDTITAGPNYAYNNKTGKLEITFGRRQHGTHDLIYSVEVSADLISWNLLTTTEVSSRPHPTLQEFDEVTFETDSSSTSVSPQFIRLRVELP